MLNHVIKRLIQMLIVIGFLSYFCFYLMSLMPGDPVDIMISSNPKISSEDVARLRSLYGLDQPIHQRYLNWLSDTLRGDLGYSRTYRVPVGELMGPRLLNTFFLSFVSLMVALLIAVPLGVLAALRPNSKLDYFLNFFAFAGISVPSFWLGIVLIILLSVMIPIFPAGGTFTVGSEDWTWWQQFVDRAKYLALPVASLSYLQIGSFVRFTRSAMLEALRNDFIRTAKAKGLSNMRIIWLHAFRNALIPLITVISLSFSGLFSGALITETVFSYQGVGKLVYESIIGNDFNVAMVSFVISVSMVLLFSWVADLLYVWVDPRISHKD